MEKKTPNFLNEKILNDVNKKIEKELIELLEEEKEEPVQRSQSKTSFFITMTLITVLVIFYKLTPIIVQIIKEIK